MKIRVFSVSDGIAHEEPIPQVVQDILHQLEQDEVEFIAEASEETLQAFRTLGYRVEGGK